MSLMDMLKPSTFQPDLSNARVIIDHQVMLDDEDRKKRYSKPDEAEIERRRLSRIAESKVRLAELEEQYSRCEANPPKKLKLRKAITHLNRVLLRMKWK